MSKEFLWVEKYRPKTIKDTILPKDTKKVFQKFVDDKNIPVNLLLSGKPGCGKTTVAQAMLNELNADYVKINASKDGNIDTLRTDIQNFATTSSLMGGRKYIILDEADHLSHHFQPALRSFIEDYSKNCSFILTCNYRNRIIAPLISRCSVVDFVIPTNEKGELILQVGKRIVEILKKEGITFSIPALGAICDKYFPDIRKLINELQMYANMHGTIDEGVLSYVGSSISSLIPIIKTKNYTKIRQWFADNPDLDPSTFFEDAYKTIGPVIRPENVPELVLILSKYQYQSAFAASQELNNLAFITEVIRDCEFV